MAIRHAVVLAIICATLLFSEASPFAQQPAAPASPAAPLPAPGYVPSPAVGAGYTPTDVHPMSSEEDHSHSDEHGQDKVRRQVLDDSDSDGSDSDETEYALVKRQAPETKPASKAPETPKTHEVKPAGPVSTTKVTRQAPAEETDTKTGQSSKPADVKPVPGVNRWEAPEYNPETKTEQSIKPMDDFKPAVQSSTKVKREDSDSDSDSDSSSDEVKRVPLYRRDTPTPPPQKATTPHLVEPAGPTV